MPFTTADPATKTARRRRWRTALLMAGSALAVAGVAAGVAWEAGRNAVATGDPVPVSTRPVSRPSGPTVSSIGAGTQPWANQYRDGRLVMQFTAAAFDPDPKQAQAFLVRRPVAVMYLRDGGFLRVTGTDGRVDFDAPAGQAKAGTAGVGAGVAAAAGGGMSSPNHGWLHRVRVDQYPAYESTRPTLTMTTAAMAFDGDTLTVYTVDPSTVDPAEPSVGADQVPVTVRGDEYRFDGRGLLARWDERDGRLLLLLVYHGEQLTIVNPGKATTEAATEPGRVGPGGRPYSAVRVAPRSTADTDDGVPSPVRADTARLCSYARVVPVAGPPSHVPPQPPTLYRATFNDAVRVDRGGKRVAVGDLLSIDFLQGPKPEAATKPATKPATGLAAGPVAATRPLTPAETELVPQPPPAARAAAERTPATVPATGPASEPPTTKAVPQPLTVYWTGELRVAPLRGSPAMPVGVGQSVVRIAGSPAVLTPDGPDVNTVVRAAVAIYRSGDDATLLDGSPAVPRVDVRDEKGAHLSAVRVGYDPASSVAVVTGPADLTVPAGTGQTLRAAWTDRAVLRVVGRGDQVQGIDRADLFGDVAARLDRADVFADVAPGADPALDLRAGRLRLDLDLVAMAGSKQRRGQLRRMTADEAVECALPHAGHADRGIDAGHLVVDMAPAVGGGDPDPRYVTADGAVRAYDDDQTLNADHVEATLAKRAEAAAGSPPPGKGTATRDRQQAAGALPAATRGAPSLGTPGEGRGEGGSGPRTAVDDRNHPHPNPLPAYRERGPEQATEPADAIAIESLHATGQVRATLKSGATADADDLRVRTVDGRQVVELRRPSGATVADGKGSQLVGRLIEVAADTGRVAVNTPGTLRHAGGRGGRPVDVAWAGSLAYDPTANTADLREAVTVTSTAADGTATRVVGDAAHLTFADPPAAGPAAGPAAKPATGPTDGLAGNKQLVSMRLSGHIRGTADLADANGAVVRRALLKDCDVLVYTAADGRVTIPGPGDLFVENHVPTTRPVATEPATKSAKRPAGDSGFGRMAIAWRTSMVYDPVLDRVTFDGDTRTGFQPDPHEPVAAKGDAVQKESDVMQLNARRLVVLLKRATPGDRPADRTADKPAIDKSAGGGGLDVASVQAVGAVEFRGRGMRFDCHRVVYDPAGHLMVAAASAEEPGETFDPNKVKIGGFDELAFDTETLLVKSGKGVTGTIRK